MGKHMGKNVYFQYVTRRATPAPYSVYNMHPTGGHLAWGGLALAWPNLVLRIDSCGWIGVA